MLVIIVLWKKRKRCTCGGVEGSLLLSGGDGESLVFFVVVPRANLGSYNIFLTLFGLYKIMEIICIIEWNIKVHLHHTDVEVHSVVVYLLIWIAVVVFGR